MKKFRVSTCINADQEDHQLFDHKIDAEIAAAELARSGFFSKIEERVAVAGSPFDHWAYVCEYAPDPAGKAPFCEVQS